MEMTNLKFDELNVLEGKRLVHPTSIPFEEYFGKMGISERDKKKRIDLARDFYDEIMYILDYLWLNIRYGLLSKKYAIPEIMSSYMKAVDGRKLPEEYEQYIYKFATRIYDSVSWVKVSKNEQKDGDSTDVPSGAENPVLDAVNPSTTGSSNHSNMNDVYDYIIWHFSPDRATFIAEEEAANIANAEEYEKAKAKGKKFKTWKCMMDGRERTTHRIAHMQTVEMSEQFVVGDSLFDYPRDMKFNPSPDEVIRCRCWCTYR